MPLCRFSIVILLSLSFASSATFENFKRSQAQTYANYKDKKDVEFAKNLKRQFKAYMPLKQDSMYETQKPSFISDAVPNMTKPAGPLINIKIPDIKNVKKKIILRNSDEVKNVSFDFFGLKQEFLIPYKLKNAKYYPRDQIGINNFFDRAASSKYENLLTDIQNVCKSLDLNDWGLHLLVKKIANNTYSDENESNLFIWFVLNKLGYNVKIGLASKRIVLLYDTKYKIYTMPKYKLEDKNYYMISEHNKAKDMRVYSYTHDYDKEKKSLDFSLKELPNLAKNMKKKMLEVNNGSDKYSLEYSYNQNIIEFMKTYPQMDARVYFNAPIEDGIYESIALEFKKHLDSKQASQAINFILSFVQNAFVYEVDKKQFGSQKSMFAQEVLFYDRSDCDDRAVLFAYLIKKLFGFSVVGVKYKDHMATALYIPMNGDSVNIDSKRYIIADPSYTNATVGQSIPKYKDIEPKEYVKLD